MPAIQAEAIHVKDPQAEATRLVNAIPVGQGLIIESPLREQLGLWRHSDEVFELSFHGNEIRGSATLAIRAVARFMDLEGRRNEALRIVAEAVGKVCGHGFAQAPAANDNKLRN